MLVALIYISLTTKANESLLELLSETLPALAHPLLRAALYREEKVKRFDLICTQVLGALSFGRSLTSTLVGSLGTCQPRRNCSCGPRRWQLVTQESNAPTSPPVGVMGRCSMHLFTDTGKHRGVSGFFSSLVCSLVIMPFPPQVRIKARSFICMKMNVYISRPVRDNKQ